MQRRNEEWIIFVEKALPLLARLLAWQIMRGTGMVGVGVGESSKSIQIK